ncbi:helix-turn-helix transcriptional regulator [Burkholderia contaminans]|nr:helix-turn-helix transcriptional regulator [Burkholderia contaminans]
MRLTPGIDSRTAQAATRLASIRIDQIWNPKHYDRRHDESADGEHGVPHQDTICPNRHRQYPLSNDRTPRLLPFNPDIRPFTCPICNCGDKNDMNGESLRRNNTMSFHAPSDSVANAGTQDESATIRAPLNEWPMPMKIRHVAEWMACNFAHPVTVRQAAGLVAMSERTLLRNFKQITGMSPTAYLTQVRLANACRMLERTALPIDSIARRCGLGNRDYLAHLFRRHFNTTATDYRRACALARADSPSQVLRKQ